MWLYQSKWGQITRTMMMSRVNVLASFVIVFSACFVHTGRSCQYLCKFLMSGWLKDIFASFGHSHSISSVKALDSFQVYPSNMCFYMWRRFGWINMWRRLLCIAIAAGIPISQSLTPEAQQTILARQFASDMEQNAQVRAYVRRTRLSTQSPTHSPTVSILACSYEPWSTCGASCGGGTQTKLLIPLSASTTGQYPSSCSPSVWRQCNTEPCRTEDINPYSQPKIQKIHDDDDQSIPLDTTANSFKIQHVV